MKTIKFDVFGRDVLVVGSSSGWRAFYVGTEGTRRPAIDIVIPPGLQESKLAQYLDDLCHEWANDRNNSVNRVD